MPVQYPLGNVQFQLPEVHATFTPLVQPLSVAAGETPHTCTGLGLLVMFSSTWQLQLSSMPLHCSLAETKLQNFSQSLLLLS